MTMVALATCQRLAELHHDDRTVIEPLAKRGVTAVPAVWDDPTVDWTQFDLTVIRNTWDYPDRRTEFLAWARSLSAVANPADVLERSTDKRYLRELAAAGVPVVPTTWCEPGEEADLDALDTSDLVIKPAVGVGAIGAGRYDISDEDHRRLADEHVRRHQARGVSVMVQPYLPAVDRAGETALVFLGGEFSHAIEKAALLNGSDAAADGLFREQTISPRTATAAELTVAEATLAVVPGGADRLAYGRVDLLPGPDGAPVVVELELCEPSLFLGQADGAAQRWAAVITEHATAPTAR